MDSGLEGTVALVCLLGHHSCVRDAGVKNKPVEAEIGEECWVQSPLDAVALMTTQHPRMGAALGIIAL